MNKNERSLLTVKLTIDYVVRLEKWYQLATLTQYEQGIAWYPMARAQCQAIANEYRIPLDIVVAMVAALSPGCPWDKNLIDTILVIEEGNIAKCSTYRRNVFKADNIMWNNDISLLSGLKVVQFYNSIMRPDTHRIACIDRHMRRSIGEFNKRDKLLVHQRKAVVNAIAILADRHNVSVPSFQAIIWLVVRGGLLSPNGE